MVTMLIWLGKDKIRIYDQVKSADSKRKKRRSQGRLAYSDTVKLVKNMKGLTLTLVYYHVFEERNLFTFQKQLVCVDKSPLSPVNKNFEENCI